MKKQFCLLILVFFGALCFSQTKADPLQKYTLSNGIPVYINNSVENQVDAIYIVVQGGSVKLTPEYSGLEDALFSTMCYGTEEYPLEKIQSMTYQNRSSLFNYSNYAGSVLGLSCINFYLDQMLPVLLDCFVNPSFDEKNYELLMTDYSQSIQQMLNNPESLLSYTARKSIYKNHPLEASSTVLPESFQNITIDNMKAHLQKILDPSRISVVAVGKMDNQKVLAELEKVLGKLEKKDTPFVYENQLPPVKIEGENITLENPSIAGSGFMVRFFSSPSVTSDDYVVACITADIYSGLLFNIVREKHGACYTPYSAVSSSASAVGEVGFMRVSNLQEIASFEKEAEDFMKQGIVIDSLNEDGTYTLSKIENHLEGYINTYINRKYSTMQTSRGIAGRYVASLLQFGNVYDADKLVERAKSITASDIERVYQKYWIDNPAKWFGIVGPGDKDKVKY